MKREDTILHNKRWEIFKLNRDKDIKCTLLIQKTQARIKHILILYTISNVIKESRTKLRIWKEEVLLENKRENASNKIIKSFTNRINKFDNWVEKRTQTKIRESWSFIQNIIFEKANKEAINWVFQFISNIIDLLFNLLGNLAFNKLTKDKLIKYMKQIKIIQVFYKRRLKLKIEEKRQKVFLLFSKLGLESC